MQVFALIDYDNVKPMGREVAKLDVEYNLEQIAKRVSEIVKTNYPSCGEISLRLYGGWTNRANGRTPAGSWIYGALGTIRAKRLGIRMTPEVAVNNIFSELPQFVGLHRDGGQKIVDTLIVADMVWIAMEYDCPIVLLSDDEDMLPGLVAANLRKRQVTLSRRRALGEAMNDEILKSLKINLEGCL